MRIPRHPGSPYAPLDLLLGAPLRVCILRVLDEAGDVRRASDVARLASANLTAIQRALEPLLEFGLVEQIGKGRGAVYRLRAAHPFTAAMGTLFGVERERRQAIPRAVSAWADRADPKPLAVWLFGSVARGEDQFGSDIDLAIVAPGNSEDASRVRESSQQFYLDQADELAESLREVLMPIADRMALTPSVIVLVSSDLLALEHEQPSLWRGLLNESATLFGPSAAALVRRLTREAAQRAEDRSPGSSQ